MFWLFTGILWTPSGWLFSRWSTSSGAEELASKRMATQSPMETQHTTPAAIQLPAPTAWPIVLAFGIALVFAVTVSSISVSILVAALALAGPVGSLRDILPHEAHYTVPDSRNLEPVVSTRPEV